MFDEDCEVWDEWTWSGDHRAGGKRAARKRSELVLLAALMGLALICACRIGWAIFQYADARKAFADLSDDYVVLEEAISAEASSGNAAGSGRAAQLIEEYYGISSIDHIGLSERNPDYVGWIWMEDVQISYPIMQEPNEEGLYIHADFSGETSVSGSIYITCTASRDFTDAVTIVYGHNMKDGSMFGKLKHFYNDENALRTPYFFIELSDGSVGVYQVFAVAKVHKSSVLYRIPGSEEGYDAYLEDVAAAASMFDGDCPGLSERNPMVVLSTCYGASGTNYRLMVFGVRQDGQ